MMATNSISNAGSLISKIYFPREVLVFSSVGNAVINLGIRAAVIVLTFALMWYAPHWQAVFVPLLLIPLFALGLGLGLFFAPINTMMNDMGRILEFVFQFGLFLAPTDYPTPVFDEVIRAAPGTWNWQAVLYWMHTLNPVSHVMNAVNALIQYGTFAFTPGLAVSTVISFLVLAMGWRFFHVCEPLLAERL